MRLDSKLTTFTAMMQHELTQNAWKGDPEDYALQHHRRELPYHVTKLSQALREEDLVRVIEHAADVANGAFFIALVGGALDPKVMKKRCEEKEIVRLPFLRRWYSVLRHPSVIVDKIRMRLRYP